MTERIDHAAEAREGTLLARRATNGKTAALRLREAQVHATLALVEQQRIANIIELSNPRRLPNGGEASYLLYDAKTFHLRPDVREALGL